MKTVMTVFSLIFALGTSSIALADNSTFPFQESFVNMTGEPVLASVSGGSCVTNIAQYEPDQYPSMNGTPFVATLGGVLPTLCGGNPAEISWGIMGELSGRQVVVNCLAYVTSNQSSQTCTASSTGRTLMPTTITNDAGGNSLNSQIEIG